ncbi:hypothetical protein K0M31_003990 [Melipona bicolor]|uniref:Endoplasmic reticulum junction formation protein lunapark n=1 Tax=Melipona bicolor TaxID=60889 RepID=A0AA40FXY2_9HYME|nr:hypothetical protein K0M31_003990 [Melipona bicolor]
MGIYNYLLSRLGRKKTTIEILEDLDATIKEIERYGYSTEQRHKKIVGTLILYSVILYIITAFIFYFYFFPTSLYDQIFYIIPLLIFPILILLTKKMVTWYYKYKISKNQDKLSTMQSEKKKILDEVTETETYKKAKEILLKFAPDQLMSSLSPEPKNLQQSNTSQSLVSPAGELRKRAIMNQNQTLIVQNNIPTDTNVPRDTLVCNSPNIHLQSVDRSVNTSNKNCKSPVPHLPILPRPILPKERTIMDRLIDYVVGDGPSNRYALICQNCDSHNGMALKEEFEYFEFRCSYCNFLNHARKQKPCAPKLMYNVKLNSSLNTSENLSPDENMEHLKDGQTELIDASDSDIDIAVE